MNYSDKYAVWQEAKPTLINILSQGNQLESITYKEWTGMNNYRSVRLILPYVVKRDHLLDLLESETPRGELNISFSEILIVLNKRNTIYLGDQTSGNYYALTGSYNGDELKSKLDYIESSEEIIYYTLEDHYSLIKRLNDEFTTYDPNGTLVPRNHVEVIDVIKVNKEIEIRDESENTKETIQKFADRAFDGSFDFVNRLKDVDGSVVFIYGYGERALKLGASGEIEYKRKLDDNIAGSPLSLTDSLKVAVDFISKYGGVPNSTYLTGFTTTGEADSGYRFTFGYRVQGYPVINSELNSGNAIEIEVYGHQVLSFKRLVRTYSKVADIPEIMGQQYKMEDVLVINSDRIHKDYKEAEDAPFSKNQMDEILQHINNVEIVYYSDVLLNSERLIPAWQIQIGSNIYYINMHSGNIIKTVKTKELGKVPYGLDKDKNHTNYCFNPN